MSSSAISTTSRAAVAVGVEEAERSLHLFPRLQGEGQAVAHRLQSQCAVLFGSLVGRHLLLCQLDRDISSNRCCILG